MTVESTPSAPVGILPLESAWLGVACRGLSARRRLLGSGTKRCVPSLPFCPLLHATAYLTAPALLPPALPSGWDGVGGMGSYRRQLLTPKDWCASRTLDTQQKSGYLELYFKRAATSRDLLLESTCGEVTAGFGVNRNIYYICAILYRYPPDTS